MATSNNAQKVAYYQELPRNERMMIVKFQIEETKRVSAAPTPILHSIRVTSDAQRNW